MEEHEEEKLKMQQKHDVAVCKVRFKTEVLNTQPALNRSGPLKRKRFLNYLIISLTGMLTERS